MRQLGQRLVQYPVLCALAGGLLAAVPLLEWLGLGLLGFALLHAFRRSLVPGLAAAALSLAANWYLLAWPPHPWLVVIALAVLLCFAFTRSWHLLLLLCGAAALASLLLLPLLGVDAAWTLPQTVTALIPLPTPHLPLAVALSALATAQTLTAALIARSLHAVATTPPAFTREMTTLKMETPAWLSWPLLLPAAWYLSGPTGLALTGLPLTLLAYLAISGLPLRPRPRHLLQALYLLACLITWPAIVFGLTPWTGLLVIVPLLLDTLIDWRGKSLFTRRI